MGPVRLRADALHWRRIEQEVIAIDVATSTYLSANGTGALIWEALVEGATPESLAQLLVDEFGIDAARARADVTAFLEELAARGLLEDEAAA